MNLSEKSKGVKVLKKMRHIFSLLLVGCLLFSTTPVGDGFMTGVMSPHYLESNKFLIHKVHEPEWKIGFRYGVDCKPEDRQNTEALQEAISFSIRRWLEPLKELNPDRPIVDKFVYELQADFISRQLEDLEGLQAVDLRVTFECPPGIANPRANAAVGIIYPPEVFMRLGTEVKPPMLHILIHELGHTFGLADTYVRPGVMRSRGGLHWTAGTQPTSIMAMAGHFYYRSITLGEDDKRGIVWLYKYFYEGLAKDDCFFADYIFVEEPRACRPKHPLIFETKHSAPIYAVRLLEEDPTIDINAQDAGGMTALHYAVMYEKEEVVRTLLDHKDIQPALKNKQEQTAFDLALAANHTAIIEMFPEPPRRKEDVNRDGAVNILDLVAVAAKFGQKDAGTADVNGDSVVDIRDLVLVAGTFGTTTSPSTSM